MTNIFNMQLNTPPLSLHLTIFSTVDTYAAYNNQTFIIRFAVFFSSIHVMQVVQVCNFLFIVYDVSLSLYFYSFDLIGTLNNSLLSIQQFMDIEHLHSNSWSSTQQKNTNLDPFLYIYLTVHMHFLTL